ncbi:hypothetical protein E2C01_077080 [Portunus trituberculatus]|uniref:Uncharacterized protein n=1 Tax=Portunus trituberculatus TaxID=210409 RepID=A0A5B7IEV4_PORTR|nr:hypothetical protein [Portunus trituberculatus]
MKPSTSTPHETSNCAMACPDPFAIKFTCPQTFSSWVLGVTGWDVTSKVQSIFVTSLSLALNEYSARACIATTVSCRSG